MTKAKCLECFTVHPPKGWGWKLYDVPVYWSLPDDGSPIKCADCNKEKLMSEVILTQIPCGSRRVICKDCIDDYWLTVAKSMGVFPD
jgi:hypothetical protein